MIKVLLLGLLAIPLLCEQHFYYVQPFAASRLPLPEYLKQTAKDVLMVNVRLQRPGETFRVRIWYTCKLPSGVEMTYERRVDVGKDELWATAAFGGDEAPQILESEFVRIRFKEEPEPDAIAESVSEAPK